MINPIDYEAIKDYENQILDKIKSKIIEKECDNTDLKYPIKVIRKINYG